MAQKISSLPIGSKIKYGKYQVENEAEKSIIWLIADKNHTDYPLNSTTLIPEKIIDLRAFDAKEPSNIDTNRQNYGNNRYSLSNIRQWLNKKGYPWFSSQHSYDVAPSNAYINANTEYDTKKGFLSCFTDRELQDILPTSIKVTKNTVTDGGGYEILTDKIFLPSITEVGLGTENAIAEGSVLSLFTNDASRIAYLTNECYNNTKSTSKPSSLSNPWYYLLRTPYSGNSCNVRLVIASGTLSFSDAYGGYYGVRPLMNLSSDIMVSDTPDSDGCYKVVYNQPPSISGSDSDLGKKTSSFVIDYIVDDPDLNDTITVVEKIDNNIIRNIATVNRNQVYSIPIDISNFEVGTHTVIIEASDGVDKTIRTYTFVIDTIPHILTLDKPITVNSGDHLEGKNLNVKINNKELTVIKTDKEKITYKGSVTTNNINLEITGKDKQSINKLAYIVY